MEKSKETKKKDNPKIITPFSKKYKNVGFHLGKAWTGSYLYKYMTLEGAIRCLEDGTLLFREPTEWTDKYEGRFYKDKIKFQNPDKVKYHPAGPAYICCFSRVNASEPAWKVYSYDNSDKKTKSHKKCVEFKISPKIIRETLFTYANNNDYNFFESVVSYDYKKNIDELHKKESRFFKPFFDNFTLDKYLSLLSLKRNAYDYEKEFRFFLVPNKNGNNSKMISIDNFPWIEAVSEIRYDSEMSNKEISDLKDAYNTACDHAPSKGLSMKKDISKIIVPFDINKMEDTDIIIEN